MERTTRIMISTAMLAAAITCGASAARAAGASIAGDCAVFSPDGGRIAFQRERGDRFDLVVRDIATGSETVVESGDEILAGQPAWGPDGSLAYIVHPVTNTAYEAVAAKSDAGCNVWLWKDGVKRRVTRGRWHDNTPSFGPDGRIYFASAYRLRRNGIPALYVTDPREANPERKMIYSSPPPQSVVPSTGLSQPSVSPDGRLLLWTEMCAFDDVWHLCIAKLSDVVGTTYRLTPFSTWAYSPRWCPDGRHVLFTGFNPGDGGWGVFVLDARTGRTRRVSDGTEPAMSADGRRIVFTQGGELKFADVGPDFFSFPDTGTGAQPWNEPERVVVSCGNMTNGMYAALGDDCRFGTERTFFVRAEFDLGREAPATHDVVRGAYKESHLGFHLYFSKGTPNFGTRDRNGRHFRVFSGTRFDGRKGVMTGIRTKDGIYLHVEGRGLYSKGLTRGAISLDHPIRMDTGVALEKAVKIVRKVEVGTGWPVNVPKPFAGEELFR